LPTLAGGIQTPVPSDQSTVRGGRVCSRKGRRAALVSFAPVRAPWQLPHMRLVDLAPKLAGALKCSLILSVGKGRTSRGTGVRGVLVVDEPWCARVRSSIPTARGRTRALPNTELLGRPKSPTRGLDGNSSSLPSPPILLSCTHSHHPDEPTARHHQNLHFAHEQIRSFRNTLLLGTYAEET
jgi:hypothetical protein